MTNNNNTTDKGNTMRKTFMVGDKAIYTPVLKGFGMSQEVTIVGVTALTFNGIHVQGICRRADGVDQIIHIEHLTHATK